MFFGSLDLFFNFLDGALDVNSAFDEMDVKGVQVGVSYTTRW